MLVNSYSALTIPAFKRAIHFIANNLATFTRSVHKDGSPLPIPHPLDDLLKLHPNAYQNGYTFWYTLFAHTAHRGNGYAQIERDAAFRPKAINNMLPEHICPIRYDHGADGGVQQYYCHIPTGTVLHGADVIHIKAGITYDAMMGLDPIMLHERTFQRAGTLDQFQTLYLQRGTNIKGTITIPAGVDKKILTDIQLMLDTFFRGPDASQDVLILSDGAEFKNTTLTPQESELSLQEAAITKQIAQITDVPPEFLYELTESKYNKGLEQRGQELVRYLFRPYIEQIEDELDIKMLSLAEQSAKYCIKLDPNELLRGSTSEQEAIVIASVGAGLRTKNEGRKLLDLPPDKDPASDKLQTLGDTGGPPTGPEKLQIPKPPVPEKMSEERPDPFAALSRIIDDTCKRVDTKSSKGLQTYSRKPQEEKVIAVNVFAEAQKKYVVDALTPLSLTFESMGGVALQVEDIAEKYSAAVRKSAVDGVPVSLRALLDRK